MLAFTIIWAALLVATAALAPAADRLVPRSDTLYVGTPLISRPTIDTDSSAWVIVAPDSTVAAGTRQVGRMWNWSRPVAGAAEVLHISHFAGASSEVTDSVWTRTADLSPVLEISHQTAKLMTLRFSGTHVTGWVTPTGKSAESIDHTMAIPPFNSSDVLLVVAAIPLGDRYSALLATYEYESGGLRLDTLRVVGREHLSSRGTDAEAWHVRISRGQGAWMDAWIGVSDRKVLAEEYGSNKRGWTLRIARAP